MRTNTRTRTRTVLTLAAVAMATLAFTVASANAATIFTGSVNNDINNAGNWDNGLPTNTGANDGTVPTGFTATNGSPLNKNITYNGNSGYVGTDFGGGSANGYDITFNGTGSSSFTSNGLFLAWDSGAANQSDFAWNSSGTLNTTRMFTRFGVGHFSQSAGIVNQNSAGTFDFVWGEGSGAAGSSFTMTGGTFNASGMMQARRGTFDMSGSSVANFNHSSGIDFGDGSAFIFNLSDGTLKAQNLLNFNSTDAINFTSGSTALLQVLNSNKSVTDIQNLILAGDITLNGSAALIADFDIGVVNISGTDYTQAKLFVEPPVVPEPATFVLAIFGLLGLCRRPRRNRR